jgi:(R,R)-butanediol dehydrogenase/meso-butanediol dehydrogenase/diacetyl reductase
MPPLQRTSRGRVADGGHVGIGPFLSRAASDFLGAAKPATDVYIDAAGVPAVIATALGAVKHRGVLTIIAVHKKPVLVDFLALLPTEVDIRMAMGYPTEIFEVTDAIIEYQDKYATIISDLVPAADVKRGLELAGTPEATDKVVITFA